MRERRWHPSLSLFGLGSVIKSDRRDRGHISSNGNSNSNSRGASRDNLVGYMEQQYDEQKETQSAASH